MKLSEAQQIFCLNIAKLILWCYEQGYKLTFGESYDDDNKGHMRGSLHYIRLAQDLNLFINGEYKDQSADYEPLGTYWKSLHPLNRWGGDFKNSDGNHFSMTYGGKS
jgi:hypothetical protein